MRVFCLAASVLLLVAAAPSANEQQWPGIHLGNTDTHQSVRWALVGASEWLTKPACKGVFREFADQTGTPLDRKLAEQAVGEAEYLRRILFRDGSNRAQCRNEGTIMFTTPGSRLVFVCDRQLADQVKRERGRLNALVIHEALHTLGLGENPPTSLEITRRVVDRCWR
jgi:hypothetical protein